MKKIAKKKTKPRSKAQPLEVPESFAPVAAAFSKDKSVLLDRGWGAGGAVLKRKGKIFAMLVKGRFVAKLPQSRVDELVAAGAGERFDPRGDGRVMKEWLAVDGAEASWVSLAREAHRFGKGR